MSTEPKPFTRHDAILTPKEAAFFQEELAKIKRRIDRESKPVDTVYIDEPITPRMHAESMAKFLTAKGYRRVSNRFGILARIDRPHWREWMAQKHAPWDPKGEGMAWASSDGMEDFYRRVYSKDTRTVSSAIARLVPTSNHDPIGFVAPGPVLGGGSMPLHADNTSWFKETP